MALVTNRRSVMNLFSDALDPYCHQVRIVMAEKGVTVEILDIKPDEMPEELTQYNPYSTVPTLVDRDLSIYHANIIMEYLDERFPHPPLMPVYPVARADARRNMYRIEHDLYGLYKIMVDNDTNDEAKHIARKQLEDALTSLAPVFAERPYFLSDEFTLMDCVLAPLLWRLPSLDITLPKQASAVEKYAERLFAREAFKASLSELEEELR
ncbi:MAG: stringent starvation protein A [Legionellales bacterium]|nr:stringent starvation protein A [Legionellales bacterium]|tara:strand:- start:348 stop:977 length:630 start_codon:yes stop_codon:yes gene_type:complete